MLSFTTDFKSAAMADIRNPRAFVEIYWGDSLSDKNIVITSNDINRIDRTGQLKKSEDDSGGKWAFFGNEFILDGTFEVMPELDVEPQMGWFNSSFSDALGDFSTAPWLQVAHDARPYSALKVVGDSEYNEYPVDFTITITHPSGPTSIPVTGNTDRIWTTSFSVITGVTAIKIEVTKWSAPTTLLKIIQFSGSFIETYDSSEINNLNILEESNANTGVVPIGSVTANELDLTLLNTDQRFSYGNTDSIYNDVLISGRKIKVWLGFVLPSGTSDVTGDVTGYIVLTEGSDKVGYMPYGIYWSKDWISNNDSMLTQTSAYDIVYQLKQNDFLRSDNYTDTVGNIIDDIMTDALNYIPDLEWSVSSDISSISWSGVYFRAVSYLETLKDIMEATLAYSYVDRTGVLIIGSRLDVTTPVSAEQQITESDYFNYESNPKIDELKNSIRVGYTRYEYAVSDEDIYTDDTEFEIPTGETELQLYISWDKTPVLTSSVTVTFAVVSSTGTVISSINVYATGADIVVSGTAGDTFTLYATGRPATLYENTKTIVSDSVSISRYGQREFSLTGNQLITSAEKANELAASILDFYGDLRNDGSLSWPGSTLVAVGDTVEVTEFKSDTVETKDFFLIKRQSIEFYGALDSEIELRRG